MKTIFFIATLLFAFSILNTIDIDRISANQSAEITTYSIIGGAKPTIIIATTFSVIPYNLTKVPYKKKNSTALVFKTSLPNFKNEGTPILNLGDVALFQNKICILRRTKKSYPELEGLISQCLDRLFFGIIPPNEFIAVPSKWYLYQRDNQRHELLNDAVGISFDFPVSPTSDPDSTNPWDGYFTYLGKPIPAGSKNLILEFKIIASDGIKWNYKSDTFNNGCDYSKASFHVYIAKGPIYADDTSHRWWYTSGFILQNTPDVVKFSVPLDGTGWAGIYAGQATDNLPAFQETLAGADWVGITFGGGCFYSHGVNVTGGTARFNLQRMYCE
jgi:hypothetical protein